MNTAIKTATSTLPLSEPMGALQTRCMLFLWAQPNGGTVKEVHAALNAQPGTKQLAYTTILTVMRNLAKRSILKQERGGTERAPARCHIFTPIVDRGAYVKAVLAGMRDGLFEGSHTAFVKAVDDLEQIGH